LPKPPKDPVKIGAAPVCIIIVLSLCDGTISFKLRVQYWEGTARSYWSYSKFDLMQQQLDFYISLFYFLTAIPYAWLGLVAWRRRPAVAITPFAWSMVGMSIWSLGYGVGFLAPTLSLKLLALKFEYIGVVIVPVFLFIFSLEFIGRRHYLPQRIQMLLALYAAFFLLLAWTNEQHYLMWESEIVVQPAGIHLLKIEYHLFFWLQTGFSYLLILMSNFLLLRELVRTSPAYRLQIGFVVIGLLSPLIGNLIFISNLPTIKGLDPTPLFFIPTALVLYWVTMKYRLLKVLPPEHFNVLQGMKDGVIVVDALERVLYINPVTENLFGRSEAEVIGQPLHQLSSTHGIQLASCLTTGLSQAELRLGEGAQTQVFEATISSMSALRSAVKSIGPDRTIMLHNITHRKEAEQILYRRELMMSAISIASTEFLQQSDTWEHTVPGVLEKMGEAADVSHVFVFINYLNETGASFTSLCYEWASIDSKSHINNKALRHIPITEGGLIRWKRMFSEGAHISGQVRDFPAIEQDLFKQTESLSMLAFPIMVENQWWGFIMFDECGYQRYWTDIEVKALHTMASIFGSAETRARTQQKLVRRQNALSLMHEIVREALQSKDLSEMLQGVVESTVRLINTDACFIALWDENRKIGRPHAAYGPRKLDYLNLNIMPGTKTFTSSAFEQRRTLIVEDVQNSTYADEYLADTFPSRSMIVIPLISNEQRLGAIFFSFDRPHHFQAEEISMSEQAASLIALAFEKFQAIEQAQRRAATSETLREASAVVSTTMETNQAIPRILEQLKRVVPYDSASIQLLQDNELEIVGGSGFADHKAVVGMRFAIPGDNPNSVVMETGQPYLMGDVRDVYKQFLEPPNDHIRAWLGVPLMVQGRIIGLLSMDSSEPNDFTGEDANLASIFASQVAQVLDNARVLEESQSQAMTDALTGLYNRRGLFELGHFEFNKAQELDRPFSAIMIDIDHFKQVNDTYGHEVGDIVLQAMAKRCKGCIKDTDIIGRYGGEEIVILLPEVGLDVASNIADRVLHAIASKPMSLAESYELDITASLGVASTDTNTSTLEVLLNRADQAMYMAKHSGRNQVKRSK
jgi:diguanylate cyclase (GGDEF)-like protein